MMEYKFRAWDRLSNPPRMLDSTECGAFSLEDLTTCELEVMQYTGLKDKNGKEIFEGDILREYDANPDGGKERDYEVCFNDGEFSGYVYGYHLEAGCFVFCEIIGDIHTHPQLLCIHCNRIKSETHDPENCALCDE